MIKFLLKTAKSIASNKTLVQVLKFIAQSTLLYIGNKLSVSPYHVDKYDMKSMVYHHNMSNDDKINPILSEELFSLYRIVDFIKSYSEKNNVKLTEEDINNFIRQLIYIIDSKRDADLLINNYQNNKIKVYDNDSKLTTSLIDTTEINEGKLYVPNKELMLITDEGKFISDNKNNYLENRLNAKNDDEIRKVIKDYHKKNNTKEVLEYFNKNMEV